MLKSDDMLLYSYRAKCIDGVHIDTHRHIMELSLGRKLASDEVVHHIDGNKLNNDISNLQVMSRRDHARLHAKELPNLHIQTSDELRRNVTKAWLNGAYDHLKKPVVAINKKTGATIKIYESIRAVEKDGHISGHVARCCAGKRGSHHGLYWKYLEDSAANI